MSKKYEGIPDALRAEVYARDNERCRWCGSTNQGHLDVHHIRYRRGYADDVLENLVSLCRACHSFVHGNPRRGGARIVKHVAQEVLFYVVANPGSTGSAYWRQLRGQFAVAGLCEHGQVPEACTLWH